MALLLLRRAARAGAAAAFLLLCATAARAAGPPDGTWRRLPPPEQFYQFSFVDPVDHRLTCLRDRGSSTWWKFDLDGGGGWSETPVTSGTLSFDFLNRMMFDAVGRRLVAVGYNSIWNDTTGVHPDTIQVWKLQLDGDRLWKRQLVLAAPPARYDAIVTLDEEGGRLFLVGGRTEPVYYIGPQPAPEAVGDPAPESTRPGAPGSVASTLLGDVWSLDLDGGAGWTEVAVEGPRLPGGFGGFAEFEPTEHRLVVFGAEDSLGNGADDRRVRALAVDGDRRWTELFAPDGLPFEPYFRMAIFDRATSRLLQIEPGASYDPAESTLFRSLDLRGPGAIDLQMTHGEPAPILSSIDQYCLDGQTRRLLAIGTRERIDAGNGFWYLSGARSDVWSTALEGSADWQRRYSSLAADYVATQTPVVLDPGSRRLLSLDVRTGGGSTPFVNVFDLDGEPSWQGIPCTGPGPSLQREGAVAVFDAGGNRLLLFGGGNQGIEFGDLWELSFAFAPPRWRRLVDEADAPRPRRGASAIYDSARRRMVLFGGYAGEERNDTWELDLTVPDPVWRELDTRGARPPARFDHSAIYDPRRDAMVVFGGASGSPYDPMPLRDTWVLSFVDGGTWVSMPLATPPPVARYGHGAVYDPVGDRMLVIGGRDRSGGRFDHQSLELGSPARWVAFLPHGSGPGASRDTDVLYDAPHDRLLTLAMEQRGIVTALEWDRDTTPKPEPTAGGFRILGMGPNPTAGDVGIAFEVPKRTDVSTRIYDVRGRVVRDLGTTSYSSGPHLVWWDGRGDGGEPLRDGVYFARITLDGQSISGKIILMD